MSPDGGSVLKSDRSAHWGELIAGLAPNARRSSARTYCNAGRNLWKALGWSMQAVELAENMTVPVSADNFLVREGENSHSTKLAKEMKNIKGSKGRRAKVHA
jgi:hypothetical protein